MDNESGSARCRECKELVSKKEYCLASKDSGHIPTCTEIPVAQMAHQINAEIQRRQKFYFAALHIDLFASEGESVAFAGFAILQFILLQ